ncbi:hypothetical protein SAMN04487996_13818 [Dyadobacter soli]|uniref:Tetratricopeptide repeat-containing protein n=1 Tax=Dyadobacter soli TaxID=659014 RepID=A0A1G8CJI4_9BACT|nr:hypothetical protein [Dyadobacter soli]SDH45647.1 hypothetical protein SAMN04487996_13818 [Dyadobacter soli]
MDFKKQFDELLVELYRTNFENGNLKLEKFVGSIPGILEDPDLKRRISQLHAECCEKQGDFKSALDIYLKLWNDYSALTPGYLPVGLSITQLYLKLSDIENAKYFAKQMIKAMETHGYENHDLAACIYLVRVASPFNEDDSTLQSFVAYTNKQLGVNLDGAQLKELEELEIKLRNEGRLLTQIMGAAGSTSKEATIQSLEEFLESAVNPTLLEEASKFYEYLKQS